MNLASYVKYSTQAFEISQQKSDKMESLEFVAEHKVRIPHVNIRRLVRYCKFRRRSVIIIIAHTTLTIYQALSKVLIY